MRFSAWLRRHTFPAGIIAGSVGPCVCRTSTEGGSIRVTIRAAVASSLHRPTKILLPSVLSILRLSRLGCGWLWPACYATCRLPTEGKPSRWQYGTRLSAIQTDRPGKRENLKVNQSSHREMGMLDSSQCFRTTTGYLFPQQPVECRTRYPGIAQGPSGLGTEDVALPPA